MPRKSILESEGIEVSRHSLVLRLGDFEFLQTIPAFPSGTTAVRLIVAHWIDEYKRKLEAQEKGTPSDE